MGVEVETKLVDERDIAFEYGEPQFRVYFYMLPDSADGSYATSAHDVFQADIVETLEWAQSVSDGRPFAVGLVDSGPASSTKGSAIHWLVGGDPNEITPDRPEWVARMLRAAQPL